MVPFIILLPLLAAMLLIAIDRHHYHAKYIAIGGGVLSLALFPLVSGGAESFTWFSVAGTALTLTTSVLPLNYMLLALVLSIGVLILVYSSGYMTLPSEQRRYYIEMLAFEAAMLAFAMAGDFIVLFIAWEFLSVTSYLLIGFWYDRDRALAAARKAITIVLIGDIALLGAIVIFQSSFHTLQFSAIISDAGSGMALVPVALLLIAVMTKSAQFPFQEWLADAMEGPAPVSAYLHSSTMVKAGAFVAIVLLPIFESAGALPAMLVIGAATVGVAIFAATTENRVKRVLAYSTVEELGLMIVAVASGALLAAIYFFFVQSFYKALLFFSAGSSMKATDNENLHRIEGMTSNRLVYITTIFGVLSLAGFVPFGGFFADIGLDYAFSTNLIAYALISLVSLTTSFYIFRWLFLQVGKSGSKKAQFNYASIPKSMSYAMAALAIGAIASGVVFFFVPGIFAGEGGTPIGSSLAPVDAIVETVLVAAGAAAGYVLYMRKRKSRLSKMLPERIARSVYTASVTNAAYAHMASFTEALAGGIAYVDSGLNTMLDRLGHDMIRISGGMRRLASGSINAYVALFAVGVLVLVLVVVAI